MRVRSSGGAGLPTSLCVLLLALGAGLIGSLGLYWSSKQIEDRHARMLAESLKESTELRAKLARSNMSAEAALAAQPAEPRFRPVILAAADRNALGQQVVRLGDRVLVLEDEGRVWVVIDKGDEGAVDGLLFGMDGAIAPVPGLSSFILPPVASGRPWLPGTVRFLQGELLIDTPIADSRSILRRASESLPDLLNGRRGVREWGRALLMPGRAAPPVGSPAARGDAKDA